MAYFVNIMELGEWVRDWKKGGYPTLEAATKRFDKLDADKRVAQIVKDGTVIRDSYVESGLAANMAKFEDGFHATYPNYYGGQRLSSSEGESNE